MARPRKNAVNKSEEIRKLLAAMGSEASPTAVSKKLAERNITASPSMVSMIKSKMKKDGSAPRRAPTSTPTPVRATATNGETVAVTDVLMLRDLTRKLGTHQTMELVKALGD